MKLKVAVDNVPVELEVVNVGPASLEKVEALKEKIKSNSLLLVDADLLAEKVSINLEDQVSEIKSNPSLFEQYSFKEDEDPQNPEQKKEHSLEGIVAVVGSLKEMFGDKKKEGMKPWYKSKTIISNAAGLISKPFICTPNTLVVRKAQS